MNVLITGASRGLGLNLAQKYLELGETVFAGARDRNAPLLVALLKKYPDTLHIVELDVASTDSVKAAQAAVGALVDHVDIVINNAAIHCDTSFLPLEETDLDDALEVYNVNALGPVRVVKEFLPMIRSQIINISSESGSIGDCRRDKEYDYCMSKAALNMASKQLYNKVHERGIQVLAIQPGWMRTDMGTQAATFDPYEQACVLIDLFQRVQSNPDQDIFIDYEGNTLPW